MAASTYSGSPAAMVRHPRSSARPPRKPPGEPQETPVETQPIASSTRALRHVFLRDLVLAASIDVHPHEHAVPQRARINLDLGVEDDGAPLPSRKPVGRDELSRVVDYEKVADTVRAIVAAGLVRLV